MENIRSDAHTTDYSPFLSLNRFKMETELQRKLNAYPSSFHTFDYLQSMGNKRKRKILNKVKSEREINGYKGSREDERALNFLSYFSFALGEYEDALEYNRMVLEKNERNINAVVNKARYHLHNSEFGETEQLCITLEELKANKVEMLYARAEHAFVCTRLGPPRYPEAENLFCEVLKDTTKVDIKPHVSKYDICLWKFGFALILKRQLNIANMHSVNLDQPKVEMERCNRALELFGDITSLDGEDIVTYQARAYVQIGEILNICFSKFQTKNLNKGIVDIVCPQENFKQKIEFCYGEAVKLDNKDVFILEKTAKYFRHKGQVEQSIDLCKRAIEQRPTSIAHHYLALALKKKLERDSRQSTGKQSHVRNLMNERTFKSNSENVGYSIELQDSHTKSRLTAEEHDVSNEETIETRPQTESSIDELTRALQQSHLTNPSKSSETNLINPMKSFETHLTNPSKSTLNYSMTLDSGIYSLDSQESQTDSRLPAREYGTSHDDEENVKTKSLIEFSIGESTGALQQTHLSNPSKSFETHLSNQSKSSDYKSTLRWDAPSFQPEQPTNTGTRDRNQICEKTTEPASQTNDGMYTNVGGYKRTETGRGRSTAYRGGYRRQRGNFRNYRRGFGATSRGIRDYHRGETVLDSNTRIVTRGSSNKFVIHSSNESKTFRDNQKASQRERVQSQLIKSPKKLHSLPKDQIVEIIFHLDASIELGDNTAALYEKGLVLRASGQSRKALEVFRTMFRHKACSLVNLSNAYEQGAHCLQDLRGSMKDKGEIESVDVNIKKYLVNAIEIQCAIIARQPSLKKCWSSFPTYKRMLEEKPCSISNKRELGKLYQMVQDYSEAITCFKQVLENETDDRGRASAHIDIAQTCVNAGDYDEAIVHLDMVQWRQECGITVDDSLYFNAHIEGGLVAYAKGEVEVARLRLKNALDHKRPNVESDDAHDNVGVLHQDDTDERDCFDVLILCDPESEKHGKKIHQLLVSLGLETTINDASASPGLPVMVGLSNVIQKSTHCIIFLGESMSNMRRIKLNANIVTYEQDTRSYGNIVVVKETDRVTVDTMFRGFTSIVFEDVESYSEAHKPWIKNLLWSLASGTPYV